MSNNSPPGANLGAMLLVLFVGLKLTGFISWSWWWVLSPLWLGPIIILATTAILVMIAVILDK